MTAAPKWSVAVVETNVFGCIAFHARCLSCGWECSRFSSERIAARKAKEHGEEHARVARHGNAKLSPVHRAALAKAAP